MINKLPMRGHLLITETDTRDGSTIAVVDEQNMIMDSGVGLLPRALSPKTKFNNKLGVFRFGNDVGNGGTPFNPSPPTPDMKETDQSVVYTVPLVDMNYFTTDTSITLSISLNGEDVVQDVDHIEYTSASIHSDNGTLFSYKRFPMRVFSRWVRVDIKWTIEFAESGGGTSEEECPVPPKLMGVTIDSEWDYVEIGETAKVRGYERYDDGSMRIIPNGSKWTISSPLVGLSNGDKWSVSVLGMEVGNTILTLKSGEFVDNRIIRVVEQPKYRAVEVFAEYDDPTELKVGAKLFVQARFIENSTKTNINTTADIAVSQNLSVVSRTTAGIEIEILSEGQSLVSVTYGEFSGTTTIPVYVPLKVTNIVISPSGNTRFDVGETLDFNATVFYNDGTSRLVNIFDRWVYDDRAFSLTEIGIVGNLRITAKYRGDYSLRVFFDGMVGTLEIKIAEPIVTINATTWPQVPMQLITNAVTRSRVIGTQSEPIDGESEILIDNFYLTIDKPNKLMFEDGGFKAIEDGNYTITVNKDQVENLPLQAVAKTMTALPLIVKFDHLSGQPDDELEITVTNPTGEGVYADINNELRYLFTGSGSFSVDFIDGTEVKFYGAAENVTFSGAQHTVEDWGHFECTGCNL